jgi:hypothetical protein
MVADDDYRPNARDSERAGLPSKPGNPPAKMGITVPTDAEGGADRSGVGRRFGLAGLAGLFFSARRFVTADGIEDLSPMDRHFLRGLDPETNLIPSDLDDDDRNVIVDDNTLVLLAR